MNRTAFVTITSDFPPIEAIRGGAQIRPYELFTNLAKMGCPIYLILTGHPPGTDSQWAGVITVRPHRFRSRLVNKLAFWPTVALTLFRTIRQIRQRRFTPCWYQTVPWCAGTKLGFLPYVAPGFVLFLFARLFNIHTWAAIHDIHPDHELSRARAVQGYQKKTAFRTLSRKWQSFWTGIGQLVQTKSASFITVPSYGLRNRINRWGVVERRVAVFPAGINISLVRSVPAWQAPTDRPWRLAYLGSPYDANLTILVKAYRELDLNGEGRLHIGHSFLDLPKDFDEENGIYYHEVKYADFGSFAQLVDLWVIPYDDDPYLEIAWQLKIPMNLASGRPVIISSTAELGYWPSQQFLYSTGRDPVRIARTIRHVMDHPDEAMARAEAGRRYVLHNLQWKTVATDLSRRLGAITK